MTETGIIFNIQRYTVSDGPGIRTELFLKGCPLFCRWCSNPEGRSAVMEPGIYSGKCIGADKCGLCRKVCPMEKVLQFAEDRKLSAIDRAKCTGCMACVDACPADAIKSWGRVYTVEEAMEEIRRDRGFYDQSGGGVTLSGGEPLLQSDFVAAVMKQCREEGIHTCLESTFCTRWDIIEKTVEYADLLISDLKAMDPDVHRKYIGGDNAGILDNLRRLAENGHEIILRIPLIPGVNDDEDNIAATADFIERNIGEQLRTIQLLSFMRLGEEKYQSLGMPYPMADLELAREKFQERVQEIADYFEQRGLRCMIGSRDKE